MRRKRPDLTPLPSEITPPDRYYSRRELLAGLAAAGAIGVGLPRVGAAAPLQVHEEWPAQPERATQFL